MDACVNVVMFEMSLKNVKRKKMRMCVLSCNSMLTLFSCNVYLRDL